MPEDPDLDDDFDDDDPDDDTPLVKKLRGEIKRLTKDAKRVPELERENTQLRTSSVIKDAGLELKPSQVTALLAAHGDKELTADLLHETAVDLGWAEAKEDVPADDLDATDRIATAANGGGTGRSSAGVITVAEAVSWDVGKQTRFMQQHPEAWEALKRGEPARGIANF